MPLVPTAVFEFAFFAEELREVEEDRLWRCVRRCQDKGHVTIRTTNHCVNPRKEQARALGNEEAFSAAFDCRLKIDRASTRVAANVVEGRKPSAAPAT